MTLYHYCVLGKTEAARSLDSADAIDRRGIYFIRWIRMLTSDIEEYTRLCLETWHR